MIRQNNSHRRTFDKIEILVVVITLLAAFFRLYRLNDFPPAVDWDGSFDGFDAVRLLLTPSHPIFFDGNTGREPLTIYLQAIGMWLWGIHPFGLRLVSAFVGIVTVPVLYRVGKSLYAEEGRGRIISVLAAALLAVSFWHVDLSRITMRIISFPLLGALAVWFFWRAWQTQRWRYYVLSGAALGLTLYTYLASRLMPLVFIGYVSSAIILAFARRWHFPAVNGRRALAGLGVMLATTLVVFVPIGIYFWQHPGAFFLRASYISIFSGDAKGWASLPPNVLATLRMFIDRGDLYPQRNIPGRSALDLITAIGFWIGMVLVFARAISRPVYMLLLWWFAINIVPGFFSVDIPSFFRTSGAIAPALLIASDGLVWIWNRVAPKLNSIFLLPIVLVFSGTLAFNDYFNNWGPTKIAYDGFESYRQTILQHAFALSQTQDVVIPLDLYSTSNAQFLLAPRFNAPRPLQSLPPGRSIIWIATDQVARENVILRSDGTVLVPQPLSITQVERVNTWMQKGESIENPFGDIVGKQVQIDDATGLLLPLNPTHLLGIDFGRQIRLLGYDIEPKTLAPGDKVRVTYYWQSLVDVEFDYWVISTLLDASSNAFGKRISDPVSGKSPTSLWRRNGIVIDSFEFLVPATAHEGKYRFEVALISPTDPDRPLPISESDDRLLLDSFMVVSNSAQSVMIKNPLSLKLGDPTFATLSGCEIITQHITSGEPLHLVIYWSPERTTTTEYSIFIHLVDAYGNLVAQQDGPPQNGNAPTSMWTPGDVIIDPHELLIPTGLLPGTWTLEVGIYDSSTGVRLPISDAAGSRLGDSWKTSINVYAQ